ncbi:MAG: histidine--tRNA ligase [Candidatus Shapirobacteria bacterium]
MKTKIKAQTLKGFRDFLPPEMAVRNYVKNILIETFETFGFLPLETPVLEYASTLTGKNGAEIEKLMYIFKDNGDREVGLRYDLTIPVSKVLAIYQNEIQLPFKRYQIQPVYRAEKPQKGRYREFTQCDIDVFGPPSPINEAELVAIIYSALTKLGFKQFTVRLNSRAILSQILSQSGLEDQKNTVLQSIDKLDKIGQDGVKDELISKGIKPAQIDQIFDYIKSAQPDEYLQQVIDLITQFGVPKEFYSFDPTLVRGLDYYTGTILETSVEEPKVGSIGGGGRYDNLIATLGGPDLPAVGYSFGLDRIVDVIQELNLIPDAIKTKTKILVVNFGAETQKENIDLITKLRQQEIPSIIYPTAEKLGKQIKYAESLNIKYVAFIGSNEAKNNQIMLKNIETTDQKLVDFAELIKILKNN